ncbi:hypothetical protein ACJMK2_017059 [Sinanodonta woodiana]|uniref:Polysaccharide lyase 14 domain-containing protein n=1 Tax=Sinanodonta woodiana TaxID=1069815 RepID=A0ABD3UVP8_SINWO
MFAVVLCTQIFGISIAADLWSWSHETHKVNINDLLKHKFEYTDQHSGYGIGEDDSLSVQEDPVHHGQYVLSVFYRRGTYSHYNHNGVACHNGEKCQRGVGFYIQPKSIKDAGHQFLSMTLEYEVFFNDSFVWQRGGKLPGLWGGSRNCSGGRISDYCFSTRLMWRPDGQGEVYAYVTHDQKAGVSFNTWCESFHNRELYHQVHCTDGTGTEIGKGAFHFEKNKWIKLREQVHLNSRQHEHGFVTLWVNDHAEIHMDDIVMRNQFNFGIDGVLFSTFYGGSDHTWACPADTTTLYRNFRLYTEAPHLNQNELVG